MKLFHSKRKEIINTIKTREKELELEGEKLHAEEVALASDGQLSSTEKQRIEAKKSNPREAERNLKTARRIWIHFALNKEDGIYMSMREVVADLGAAEGRPERYESMMAGFLDSEKRRGLGVDHVEWLERLGGYGLDIRA